MGWEDRLDLGEMKLKLKHFSNDYEWWSDTFSTNGITVERQSEVRNCR